MNPSSNRKLVQALKGGGGQWVSRSSFSLILPVLGVTLGAACWIKPWPLSESLSMRCVCVCARAVCGGGELVDGVQVLLAVVARFLSLSSLSPSLLLSLSLSLSLFLSLSLHTHTHARAGGGDGRMASVACESHVHNPAWRTGLCHTYVHVCIHARTQTHTNTHTVWIQTHTATHSYTHTHTHYVRVHIQSAST